jgi:hypothetical protein
MTEDEKNKCEEFKRLRQNKDGSKHWHKWGPYLSEREWGTVREDYSPDGNAWDYFSHDQARSRVYRWGEDGLGGISDHHQEMCFAFAFWNGKDPILKERLFGLTGHEGNHGEDVKELYYYLDNSPTHSYMKMLYKYPQNEYPYKDLVSVNQQRSKSESEYELLDTGIFNNNEYWDIFIEYAKADEEDILIKLSLFNRSKNSAEISVLPTLWFRNRWVFGLFDTPPKIFLGEQQADYGRMQTEHAIMGRYSLYYDHPGKILFTENETNNERLFNSPNKNEFVKDAFHRAVINNDFEFLKEKTSGTKGAPLYTVTVEGEQSFEIKLRLCKDKLEAHPFENFRKITEDRLRETDEFYEIIHGQSENPEYKNIQRQSFAGLLWSKQYYNINIEDWLQGDRTMPTPPASRLNGRNSDWKHLNNADIISMPDKWEYPWYASWDLAFQCVPMAMIDPDFSKHQLLLIMREWYMQPNGQIPAYEWSFSDVNPPVHAWAALKIYEIDKNRYGNKDIDFLKKIFSKLLLNFTWWVNRKDESNNNIFEGGFLGLDNVGIFDRTNLPGGLKLEQADATSWMAMYAGNMLTIALEISLHDPTYEDVATKFYEHFVYISEAFNQFGAGEKGLWNEEDGFYYDMAILPDGNKNQIRVRSIVGLSCLFSASIVKNENLKPLESFYKRFEWFRNYRLSRGKFFAIERYEPGKDILLSIIPTEKLKRILKVMLDESEFLSDYGIRSISKYYKNNYYSLKIGKEEYGIGYEPGEATSPIFGGNSNWRGPIWIPMNYLFLEALDTYYEYYGDGFTVEFPSHSGEFLNLNQIKVKIAQRLLNKYLPDKDGRRPIHGEELRYANDPHFKNLLLFYEYFHGDSGRGCGASHQTGWGSLISEYISSI